jgi:2-C-methyl-D-erythritol 4-phosphate cytidylyltransferase
MSPEQSIPSEPHVAVILLAAGAGSRVGHATNKVFLPLAGCPVVSWSMRAIRGVPSVGRLVLVVSERDRVVAESVLGVESRGLPTSLVIGGMTRHASEWNALQTLAPAIGSGDIDVVVVHDAARPFAGTSIFADVIGHARTYGGALPVRPQPALIPFDASAPAPTREVVAVQTPQAFRAQPLLAAYQAAELAGFTGTDTASCLEEFQPGLEVYGVPGSAANTKITFADDLVLAEYLLGAGGLTA